MCVTDRERFTVRVRLFAILVDLAGSGEVEVEMAKGATGRDLLEALTQMYPKFQSLARSLKLALNHEYVPWESEIRPGDEIALIPPVSGGASRDDVAKDEPFVEVTGQVLSTDEYQARVSAPECGAVALFVGIVREFTGDRQTVSLKYEAYGAMAEKEMKKLADEIVQKWPEARVALGHRVGNLGIGEASVIVAVATPHRDAAFEAARYGIDTLKERVPIWKKEVWSDGEEWVGIHA